MYYTDFVLHIVSQNNLHIQIKMKIIFRRQVESKENGFWDIIMKEKKICLWSIRQISLLQILNEYYCIVQFGIQTEKWISWNYF